MDISCDSLAGKVKDMLDDIQKSMFDAAKQKRDACIQVAKTWDEFKEALSQRKMILAPWCDEEVLHHHHKLFHCVRFYFFVVKFLVDYKVSLFGFCLVHASVL